MSLTCGFYNSINNDRKYNTKQISEMFDGLILDGVFMTIGDALITTADTGMTVNVGSGKGWFNNTWTTNDSAYPIIIDASELVLNRIDTVVLEIGSGDGIRDNAIKSIKGTPATVPVAPTLTNTLVIHQYPLCNIYVGKNVVEITQANITNRIGTTECPFVVGVNQGMDVDVLLAQWDAEFHAFMTSNSTDFTTWLDTIKGQLSGDIAGNLQIQINDNKDDFDSHKADNLYQTAGGTGTAITLTIGETLVNGLPVNFIASANNNSGATTINSKPLYKPNTTTAPNLITGKPYTVVYNLASDCFFVKASAEGTAGINDVYVGKTFSNDNDTGLIGTNPYKVGANITCDNLQYVSGGNGTKVWENTAIGYGWGIAVDSAGNVIVGHGNSVSPSVVKYNSAGGQVWSNSEVTQAYGVATDSAGNVYVTYYKSAGSYKTLRKFNSAGTELWSKTTYGSGYSLVVDSAGNVYVSFGNSGVEKTDSAGNMVWFKSDVGNSRDVAVDDSGNVYIAYLNAVGTTTVRKLNSAGVQVWALSDIANAIGIAVDSTGVYVCYNNPSGKTLRKLDSDGNELWSITNLGSAQKVAVDSLGYVYATGSGADCKKLTSAGVEIFSIMDIGGCYDIAVDSNGNYVYCCFCNPAGSAAVRKLNGRTYYSIAS